MIEKIVSIELPIDEKLVIQKNRLASEKITRNHKRCSIVTGIHGDELEGQYVCYEVIKRIKKNKKYLNGIVDVYPALNPLGLDSLNRGVPMFDVDLNRTFPGSMNGNVPEYLTAKIIDDIIGSDFCLDIHASNMHLREMPQVRMIFDNKDKLLPYAKKTNVDIVWVHGSSTIHEATLAHTLNMLNVPTIVTEMGVGMHINPENCEQLLDGIFNILYEMGIWTGPVKEIREPKISFDEDILSAHTDVCGIFIPKVALWDTVEKGQCVGKVINSLTGEEVQRIFAPQNGKVFSLRDYPVVYEGTMVIRVAGGQK